MINLQNGSWIQRNMKCVDSTSAELIVLVVYIVQLHVFTFLVPRVMSAINSV